ncbi:3-oxoacyl-ACP synthase III family protein [Streptomyces prasinus]|uniref:3-oxoacyl-ACP synthase III family protein n=1 Tax=Streptomyces prasinus TaxID=67345 RepID=UPI0033CA0D65
MYVTPSDTAHTSHSGTALLDASRPEEGTGLTHPVGIMGTGLYLPERVVSNAELVRTLDTTDEWITMRTGIRERRYLAEDQVTSDMAIAAAHQALERSGVPASAIDAVIVATFTPDQPLPGTALTVMHAIGARSAVPLDLTQVGCAGAVHGIFTAAHLLQNERFRNVLVIGADAGSRAVRPTDRTLRPFLGDAAGAVVLGRTEPGYGIVAWHTDTEPAPDVQIRAGGTRMPTTDATVAAGEHYLRMDGKAVWRMATDKLPATILETARRAGIEVTDIEHFVVHQANLNILRKTARVLGIEPGRVPLTVPFLGNTAAASPFTVLHEVMESRVAHGDRMILASIGPGYVWGSICFRHHL